MSKDPIGLNENHSMNRTYGEIVTGESVGRADAMPGTNGAFTMAAFTAASVPVGTLLYKAPVSKAPSRWNTGEPPVEELHAREFIVAVMQRGVVYRFAAYFVRNYSFDNSGPKTGWFAYNPQGKFIPLLQYGNELKGWMDMPEWSEE